MELEEKLKEYKEEIEKARVLVYHLQGAIKAIEDLIESSKNENRKDTNK